MRAREEHFRGTLFLMVNIAVVCLLVDLAVKNCFACYTPIPPHGPRLMKAKALFGAIMKDCNQEIFFMLKNIEPKKFKTYFLYTCAMVENCMASISVNTTWVLLDCIESATNNKSNPAYTAGKASEAMGNTFFRLVTCIREGYGNTSFETLTDGRAYAVKVVKEFGSM